MAKIKVRGVDGFVTISDADAKKFKADQDAGLIDQNAFFSLGGSRFRPKDIVGIWDDEAAAQQDHHGQALKKHWEDYNAIVKLPIDQKVAKQEKLFNLWCKIMAVEKKFEDFKPLIKEFLLAHPKRAWMKWWDIAKEWNVNKRFNIIEDRTLMMLSKMEEEELKQEAKESQYEQSLKQL